MTVTGTLSVQEYIVSLVKLCILGGFSQIRPKKMNVVFPLTRPPLFYRRDPTDFIGKLVDTELKEQCKTVIPLNGDCKFAGQRTILMRPFGKGTK